MGVTHIVIHPTSRLTLLLSRRVLSRAPPRAAFSGGGRRGAAAAHRMQPRRASASPPRGPLAAPDWLCSGRQWPQPLLLLPPARGPYGWTPRAAAGAVAVEREAALSWIRIQVRCCCSELRAVRAVPAEISTCKKTVFWGNSPPCQGHHIYESPPAGRPASSMQSESEIS